MNGNARTRIDYTRKDFDALLEDMLALARERLPAWTDHSANDPGRVLYELAAHGVDTQLYYIDRLANESYLETAVEERSLVNLLRLIGYELRPPKPAAADLTLYFDPAAVGVVTVPTGARFETPAKLTGTPVPFQYIRPPLAIAMAQLPLTTYQGAQYRTFVGLPVVQADEAVANELLGSSDGTSSQRFRLARRPLIDGSLTVLVDEGAGPRGYEVRESLLQSGPTDRHVSVRRDELDMAVVEFGTLKHARIPPRGRNNLQASYLIGGGEKGNVPAESILTAVSVIPSLKKVANVTPASGGSEREPIAEAALRAPRQFRSRGRAVTAEDYQSHALQFGVGKARARAAGWNTVELFVAPAGGGYPSDTLKEDLRAYFDSRRILTSILDIRDPKYAPVVIEGTLEVEPYFFTQQVVTRVQDAVAALLGFGAVDFAATLYLSKVYEAVEAIEGVRSVTVTHFNRADAPTPLPVEGKIEFAWDEIPVPASQTGIALTAVTGGSA